MTYFVAAHLEASASTVLRRPRFLPRVRLAIQVVAECEARLSKCGALLRASDGMNPRMTSNPLSAETKPRARRQGNLAPSLQRPL